MKLVPISYIFDIEYGNKLDLNKLTPCEDVERGIAFVSRTSKNNGVVSWVEPIINTVPYSENLITVTLGGTYLLSAFVQQQPFYTAQNIKVLTPKFEMSVKDQLVYCAMIKHNRFRYTSHGREANKTFNDISVPSLDEIQKLSSNISILDKPSKFPVLKNDSVSLNDKKWKEFLLTDLFSFERGRRLTKASRVNGDIPFVTAGEMNLGLKQFINNPEQKILQNKITIDMFCNSHCHFNSFSCDDNILTLESKNSASKYIMMFIVTILNLDKYKYQYGRQYRQKNLVKHKIKLPAQNDGTPDFNFMEDYIKSLPYSSNL